MLAKRADRRGRFLHFDVFDVNYRHEVGKNGARGFADEH